MKVVFSSQGWNDYLHWQTNDKQILKRINELIKDVQRSPYQGIGKPEPLKHALSGFWSRRINEEHRLVYRVEGASILIAQARYHY
ncbi:MAG: Txe/YoeB family addiction module toxin [Kiritimatiellota bacterium]|jgi:toxin YoeB|nr:Txe/YoeB family addiction module toxin [Kiritimatiellota bacterium]